MHPTEYTQRARLFVPVVRIRSPHPLTRKRVLLPPFGSKEGDTLAAKRVGEPNSDEETDTPLLCVYNNPSTIHPLCHKSQSRQSAKLFLQSSELELPHPSPAGECVPPPRF